MPDLRVSAGAQATGAEAKLTWPGSRVPIDGAYGMEVVYPNFPFLRTVPVVAPVPGRGK
jgi:hypothetical protein